MTILIFTSGLKARKSRASSQCLYFLCLFSAFAFAAEPDSSADMPDLELLEFLGEWDDGHGNWLDPIRLSEALEGSKDRAGNLTEEPSND